MTPKQTAVAVMEQPQAAKLTDAVALVRIESHSFWNSRKIGQSQYEVDGGDKTMTSANRKLLDSKELDEINSVIGQASRFVRQQALPFPIESVYMIPITKVEEIAFALDKFRERLDAAVEKFCAVYEDQKEDARKRNPRIFNPAEYAPLSSLRKKFDLSYQFITIGVPDQQMREASPALLRKARQDSERMWADAAEMTRQMQAEIMAALVGKLREKLEDDENGKPKKLRDVTVTNLTDFLREFEQSSNVTNFEELGKLVQEGRKLLNGTTRDKLHDSAMLRDKLHADLKAIERKLEPLVGERKVRRGEEF